MQKNSKMPLGFRNKNYVFNIRPNLSRLNDKITGIANIPVIFNGGFKYGEKQQYY